jgi:alkylhydroperoxidase/carboxymuconolactone decarboxylase family protein YurZ
MKQFRIFGFKVMVLSFALFSNYTKAQDIETTGKKLSEKEKSIITIASFTAKGDLKKLKTELNTGLEAGLTVNEVKEVLVHTYAYCGFPRSIRGLQTFMEVLNERKAKGVMDVLGNEDFGTTYQNATIEYTCGIFRFCSSNRYFFKRTFVCRYF